MDLARIKALIDLVSRSQVTELELTEGDTTLRLRRTASAVVPTAAAPMAATSAAPPSAPTPASVLVPAPDGVRATSFGILHRSPAPDAPPFVVVGDWVEAGQTLCLIEAMKVFTALTAPRAGTVDAILIASGEEVEAGQLLIRLAA